jgi:hypothetical protein
LNPYLLKYKHFYKITFLSSFLINFFCKVERKSYLPYLIGVFYNIYFLILYNYGLVSVNACFFYFQFFIPFFKIGHKKYVHFLFFDLRIVKKNEKFTLDHNGLICNFCFIKVLLNFLFLFFEKYLGTFYVTII